jgi:hypothetical protein
MTKRMKSLLILAAALLGSARAEAQTDPTALTIGMYAPSAPFADKTARLNYVQGLAKAIQTKTGVATTGKNFDKLDDLVKAKPDFAVVDGQCIAAKSQGTLLANANINGDTSQSWALFANGGNLPGLQGKKLAYMQTGCRDADFLDNAMLDSEVKTATFFGGLVSKPDVGGAVVAVRDAKLAEALFAPVAQAKGLTKIFDAGSVPNPGFVAVNKGLSAGLVDKAKDAVLGYGAGGGIDGWKAANQGSYNGLQGRMGARVKKPVFASPDPVRMDDNDVVVVPKSEYEQASVKQHFWEP